MFSDKIQNLSIINFRPFSWFLRASGLRPFIFSNSSIKDYIITMNTITRQLSEEHNSLQFRNRKGL